jgi:hypothetical protein
MKALLILIVCMALAACTHTWNGETDLNGYHSKDKAHSGLTNASNTTWTKKRQSQFKDCEKVHEGNDEAIQECKRYQRAGLPNTDERCDDCVDNPLYGWDRFYGGYGY